MGKNDKDKPKPKHTYTSASLSERQRKAQAKKKAAKKNKKLKCFCKVIWILVLVVVLAIVAAYLAIAFTDYNKFAENTSIQFIRSGAGFEDDEQNLRGRISLSVYYSSKEPMTAEDLTMKILSPEGEVVTEIKKKNWTFGPKPQTLEFNIQVDDEMNSGIKKEINDIVRSGNDIEWNVSFEGGKTKSIGIPSFKKYSGALNEKGLSLVTSGPYF